MTQRTIAILVFTVFILSILFLTSASGGSPDGTETITCTPQSNTNFSDSLWSCSDKHGHTIDNLIIKQKNGT